MSSMLLPPGPTATAGGGTSIRGRAPAGAPVPAALQRLMQGAGIEINGPAPWDLQLHDRGAWRRMLTGGTLGFGESYMDGQWDCERVDELVCRLMRADVDRAITAEAQALPAWVAQVLRHGLANLQSVARAFHVGERHYDLGNDLFAEMLDSRMVYSCAYWPQATSLEQAQQHKLELIGRKLELAPGQRLLDLGCGWGGLAAYAARHFGCEVVGATISKEQAVLARERCAGLPVTIELKDWRSLGGRYDKIASVGMFEHVGPKNYAAYFDRMRELLSDDGLLLLHTIGIDRTERATNPWIDRYIFPNGKLPSALEIARACEGRFVIEDWHNFAADYDRTLMAWWERFERAWPRLRPRYGGRFHRMWKLYLLGSAGFFRSRQGQLWQLVLAPRSRTREYRSVR